MPKIATPIIIMIERSSQPFSALKDLFARAKNDCAFSSKLPRMGELPIWQNDISFNNGTRKISQSSIFEPKSWLCQATFGQQRLYKDNRRLGKQDLRIFCEVVSLLSS